MLANRGGYVNVIVGANALLSVLSLVQDGQNHVAVCTEKVQARISESLMLNVNLRPIAPVDMNLPQKIHIFSRMRILGRVFNAEN